MFRCVAFFNMRYSSAVMGLALNFTHTTHVIKQAISIYTVYLQTTYKYTCTCTIICTLIYPNHEIHSLYDMCVILCGMYIHSKTMYMPPPEMWMVVCFCCFIKLELPLLLLVSTAFMHFFSF